MASNAFCQKEIDTTETKDLSALFPDTVKYYISSLKSPGKDEISEETLVLEFEESIDLRGIPNIILYEILEVLFEKYETLNKLYPFNFKLLSKKLQWSTHLKNKRYETYTDVIIELVHAYYAVEENYYRSSINREDRIDKPYIYETIKQYGIILNQKSLLSEIKRINDLIYQYDSQDYTNLIFRANYFRNTLQFDQAIRVLNDIGGYEFNEDGDVINNYNPNEVYYFLALTYYEMGDMEKALEAIDYMYTEDKYRVIYNDRDLRNKILNHK